MGWLGLVVIAVIFVPYEVIGTKYRKWWTVSQGFARLRRWNHWVADGSLAVIAVLLFFHLVLGYFNQVTP